MRTKRNPQPGQTDRVSLAPSSSTNRVTVRSVDATSFYEVFGDIPIMMHSIDDEFRLVAVNDHWLKVMGYDRRDVLGKPVLELLSDRSRRLALDVDLPRLRKTGQQKGLEVEFVKKNGETVSVLLSAKVNFDEAGRIKSTITVLTDITDRKRAQDDLQKVTEELEQRVTDRTTALLHSNRQLAKQNKVLMRTEEDLRMSEQKHRALLELNNALIANLDRESLFQEVTKALRKVVDFDRASIALYDPEREVFKAYGLAGVEASSLVPTGTSFNRSDQVTFFKVMDAKKPQLIGDLNAEADGQAQRWLAKEGFRSAIITPMIVGGKTVGTLNIANRKLRFYTRGNVDFLFEVGQQIALAVENVLSYEIIENLRQQAEQKNTYLLEEIKTQQNFGEIIGDSLAIQKVRAAVETVAPTDASVLIHGETGTGKELVARAIHVTGRRKDKPLIKVNCATIPRELFESEFFGHVKGSFTGAIKDRIGRFELADGGTLFLDEVGEIPLELQGKLLRVLQEGEFERIGDERTMKVDVRIVAATNRDLKEEVAAKRFRQDLYFRLSVFPIEVAPLRDRVNDVSIMAKHFVEQSCRRLGVQALRLQQRHMAQLESYSWPGNVRELQNVLERGVIAARSGGFEIDLPAECPVVRSAESGVSIGQRADGGDILSDSEFKLRERDNVVAALRRANWKLSGELGAAELLGLKVTTLASKMKSMGIRRPM